MESALLALLALLAVLFVLYWLIRTAVHHGIIDAGNERARLAERAERAELDRVRRERPSRYVENDPDV